MKKVILSAVLAAMVLNFTGCGEQEEVKTVDYYKEHEAERKAKIEECKNNPGELRGTPNCINATTAKMHSGKGFNPSAAPSGTRYQNFGQPK